MGKKRSFCVREQENPNELPYWGRLERVYTSWGDEPGEGGKKRGVGV